MKKMMKMIAVSAAAASLLFCGGIMIAAAQSSSDCPAGQICYTPLEPLPGVPESGTGDFGAFLSGIFKLLVALGALLALVTLTVGGVIYMTSAASRSKNRAVEQMEASIWGLLILIASVLILQTVNPNLLKFDVLKSQLPSEIQNATK